MVVLLGFGFYAFAGPAAETRKRVMAITGIAGLVMFVAAFGLMHKLGYSWSAGWIWVKILCWLGLSALPGIAYRRRGKAGALAGLASVLALVALVMVYYKPF